VRCREIVELMTEYLDGALAPDRRVRFEEHLAGCEGCRAYLEELRTARRVAGALATAPVPDHLRAELLRAFRGFESKP